MLFSIGSLYVVKTIDRDGATRDRNRVREAVGTDAPMQGLGSERSSSDPMAR